MPILFSCKCGKPLKAREELAGKKIKCPHCGVLLTAPSAPAATRAGEGAGKEAAPASNGALAIDGALALDGALAIDEGPAAVQPTKIELAGGQAPAAVTEAAPPDESDKKYKVLTTKDLGFVAKFDAAKLEEALNQHWKKGWAVRSTVRITVTSHGTPHDELVFILER
jgi:hypothetical protein